MRDILEKKIESVRSDLVIAEREAERMKRIISHAPIISKTILNAWTEAIATAAWLKGQESLLEDLLKEGP